MSSSHILSLFQPLQFILNRPNFWQECEQWRQRKIATDVLKDVYDGAVWKEFQSYDGLPFLSEEGNIALMLNMDFFQPFKHVNNSIGAIYVTILNLPRGIRNKRENALLIGLIPGPHEPKRHINTY